MPVVKAPWNLLPDVMPDTRAKAKPEPNADIILQSETLIQDCKSLGVDCYGNTPRAVVAQMRLT